MTYEYDFLLFFIVKQEISNVFYEYDNRLTSVFTNLRIVTPLTK